LIPSFSITHYFILACSPRGIFVSILWCENASFHVISLQEIRRAFIDSANRFFDPLVKGPLAFIGFWIWYARLLFGPAVVISLRLLLTVSFLPTIRPLSPLRSCLIPSISSDEETRNMFESRLVFLGQVDPPPSRFSIQLGD
jgi:hypothetical protein